MMNRLVNFVVHNCNKSIFFRSNQRHSNLSDIKFVRNFSENLQKEDDSDVIVKELCGDNESLSKKLKILMLEVEVMRQDGRCAPDVLNASHWKRLLDLGSRNQRTNYLTYLFKVEKSKEQKKIKQETKRKEYEERLPFEKENPDDLQYGISHESLFLRIRDGSINNFDNYRALQAMTYGQSIVIDCSYDENMSWREAHNAAKQVTYVFGDNRLDRQPFNIHLCNVNWDGEVMAQLKKFIPPIQEPWFPLNFHTKSYLDVFPKNNLVYLTPHCNNELTEFDHDAVYIVGCMVDKKNNEPLSLAKAKRDNLKMAKLPLDRYLEWGPGAKKNLNINHMLPILLDLKSTGDWEYAFRHVPRRKLMDSNIGVMHRRLEHNTKQGRPVLIRRNYIEKRQQMSRSLFDDDSV